MASRRRTLLLLCALGFAAVAAPATLASAAPAQDPGASFGGAGAETTTTVAATTTTTASSETNQTLVESEDTPDEPIFTENRKVAAIIGALVVVAIALLLLTIRYVRVTKPSAAASVDPAIPMLPIDLDLNDDSVFVDEPIEPASPAPAVAAAVVTEPVAPGTDHDAADDDWEPRTDEHQRVEIPTGTTLARPSRAARRKALGVDPS
ncbi:hypothetical protein ACE2AJ_19015 [Aquihabitans daechungensis]|uniref:hypothetical protein n=1 Tax=Aquihabitans daechungensis TaxID=1052257 RepID=UPI003BA23FE0